MPALTDRELLDPVADPLSYPGHPLVRDALLVGGWRYTVLSRPDVDLADLAVHGDGGLLVGRFTLAEALDRLGVAPPGERRPVVAVGSNAAPGQLARKFADVRRDVVLPLTVARVPGLGVGHSAHVGRAGYLPYAPVADPTGAVDVAVLWLDPAQEHRLTETEPNYDLVTLSPTDRPALLRTGRPLAEVSVYRGRWGVYRRSPDDRPLRATTQREILRDLAERPWFTDLVPESARGPRAAVAALVADPERRVAVRTELARRGLRAPDGLATPGGRTIGGSTD